MCSRLVVRGLCLLAVLVMAVGGSLVAAESNKGYYRYPAVGYGIVVFNAEGDLWRVADTGGLARRITSHHGFESSPAISPDGTRLAFTAQYEGPTEVYVMPIDGGLPRRLTYDGAWIDVVGWRDNSHLLVATSGYSTLPSRQLHVLDIETLDLEPVELAQAADGVFDDSNGALFFTRLPFQGSHAKRYPGGTAQQIWRYLPDDSEATPLTTDYAGTSRSPMWHGGRVYFVSDRDGTMNIWSMDPFGADLRQHTFHDGWDIKSVGEGDGTIVYQLGADLRLHDIASNADTALSIVLSSDFDQQRQKWIEKPMDYLTTAHLSTDNERVVLTARGQVFTAPVKTGRIVEASRADGVRYREAAYLPGDSQIVCFSDESGEVELWLLDPSGSADRAQLSGGGTILRFNLTPSPEGRYLAYTDKNFVVWVFDRQRLQADSVLYVPSGSLHGLAWSPDSRWLTFAAGAENTFDQIWVYDVSSGDNRVITSDRYESYSPAFSPDGVWLYFVSQRDYSTVKGHVWGPRAPQPYLPRTTKVYMFDLAGGKRSPFLPDEEKPSGTGDSTADADDGTTGESDDIEVVIDFDGLETRLYEVPLKAGNYRSLAVAKKYLFYTNSDDGGSRGLYSLKITNDDPEEKELVDGISGYDLSADGSKLLVQKGKNLYVIDASDTKPSDLGKSSIDLSGWRFPMSPREEWRQMFIEAWRFERDYFYDTGMHGVDWSAVRDKYLPLVDRVTTRGELSDLLGQMISELSALHMTVGGGDHRKAAEDIQVASLGARLKRDEPAGGYRVEHIYRADPERPDRLGPLQRPEVDIQEGDVILAVNGVPVTSVEHIGELLRDRIGTRVLLEVQPEGGGDRRHVTVEPIGERAERSLRYDEWELTRREQVEELGGADIGYVHLRALGTNNYSEWARDFFPVWNRDGLIIDMRHNGGGNIDSWILGSLLRRPWLYWQPRVGDPDPNFQYGFNGHIAVLCNEWTSSDGEMFLEGIRRLSLGRIIGTRTWGGGIWLSYSNRLVDKGIASAAEFGVFAPEGRWLIEWHGVSPDTIVDNLPHETFLGRDAQLEAAIDYLKARIAEEPPQRPVIPEYPDRTLKSE